MKKQETDRINQLRVQGVPPSVIARELGLSINTITLLLYSIVSCGIPDCKRFAKM